jgi:site-specific DNA-methyltransferase (adenine-specific)
MSDFIQFEQPKNVDIIIGDCVEVMRKMRDEGVQFDAIVSDPPYGIDLHGYGDAWDNGELVFNASFWKLCYDVLKPGGFLLAFAASRKYHRVAVAVEDAGFEIYPMLQWLFPGGLPKPANLSELFDRDNVKERKVLETKAGSGFTSANAKHGAQQRLTKEFEVKERGVSEEAKDWLGYYYGLNTLKPAIEPIVIAQKPKSEKRMIDNVRTHGVGALNIGAFKERDDRWPTTVFEYAKSSVRDHQSNHPSVKPIDLMADLCLLACPTGGHILDPFAGTGSTGAGAARNGFACTLIEQNEEMREAITKRLNQSR